MRISIRKRSFRKLKIRMKILNKTTIKEQQKEFIAMDMIA